MSGPAVTIRLLAVPRSAPSPPPGPAPLRHPPSLITQGPASGSVPPPCLSLLPPGFCYLLAVHFQILSIDLHPDNDHLIIPLPPDGSVPEAARVQWVVDTPNDLGGKRQYPWADTEGQQVTQSACSRSGHFGVGGSSGAKPSAHLLSHFPASNQTPS